MEERRQGEMARDREHRPPTDRPVTPPERLDRLFGALDANGDGRIDREEMGDRLPGVLQRLGEAEGPARPGDLKGGPAVLEQLQRRLDERIDRRVKEILEKRLPELIERKLREARVRMGPEQIGRGLYGQRDRSRQAPAFRPPGWGFGPAERRLRSPLSGPRVRGDTDRGRRGEGLRGLPGAGAVPPGIEKPGRQGPVAGVMAFRMLDADRDGRLQTVEIRRLIGLLDKAAAESERKPINLDAWQKLLGEHRPLPGAGPRPEPKEPRPDCPGQDRLGPRGQRG